MVVFGGRIIGWLHHSKMRNSRKVDYLRAYLSWCKEFKEEPVPQAEMMSNEALKEKIEELLEKHNDLPFITE